MKRTRRSAPVHCRDACCCWCKDALDLKKRWDQLSDAEYELKVSRLEDRLDRLMKLRDEHADAQRLLKRLHRHRDELTRFLWDEKLDGTNNAAERAFTSRGGDAKDHRRQSKRVGRPCLGQAGESCYAPPIRRSSVCLMRREN